MDGRGRYVRGVGVALVSAVLLCLGAGAQAAVADPTISVDDTGVLEGTGTNSTAHFTVTLSQPAPAGGVTVDYHTVDGSAAAPADYTAIACPSGVCPHVTIPEGATSAPVDVTVVGDATDEPDETFTLQLTNPQAPGLTNPPLISDPIGVATIEDDDPAPTVSVADATTQGGPAGTGSNPPVTFTLTLSAPSAKALTVAYQTQDGTGPNGAHACPVPTQCFTPADGDYVPTSGTRTFPAGVTTQTVSVTAVGDSLDVDENFNLVVTAAADLQSLTARFAPGDIGRPISVDGLANTISSWGSVHEVTLSSPAPSGSGRTIFWGPASGDGIVAGTDLTSASTAFAGDDVGKGIMVGGVANTIAAVVNNHEITLQSASAAGTNVPFFYGTKHSDALLSGGVVTAVGSIPSAGPHASIANVIVNEGPAGTTTTANVTVTLDAASPQDVSLAYATTDGTAKAPVDYEAVPAGQRLTIPAGQITGTIPLHIKGNNLNEADKTLTVTISAGQHVQASATPATVTIKNDDPTPGIVAPNMSVAEPSGGATGNAIVNVSLSGASGRVLTANYATADGTAIAGTNYGKTTGTLTFNPGETTKQITVPIGDDGKVLDDQSFTLAIQNTADGGGSVVVAVTILEGDLTSANTPSLSISDASVRSTGGPADAVFTVRMDQSMKRHVTVDYATANGTATAPRDYVPTRGTLTFAPGEVAHTISVPVTGNAKPKFNEDFTVRLSNPTSARVARDTGNGIIINDKGNDLAAGVSPSPLRATSFLCRRAHRCAGLLAHWKAPDRGKVRITVASLLPPAAKGKAARRVVLVTRSVSVKVGAGRARVKLRAGRDATRLLRLLHTAKAKTAIATVTFTDGFGAQTSWQGTLPLRA
jgi:hypothetical protein